MTRFLATASSILSALAIALLAIVGAINTPGYSHFSQYISELGATGAPQEIPIRFFGFLPAGLALLLFSMVAYFSLPRSRTTTFGLLGLALYALGYVAAAFFPCDPGCRPAVPSMSQVIHNAVGLLGYVAAPLFLFLLARSARTWPGAAWVSRIGFIASAVSLLGLLTLSPGSPLVGVSQRAMEAAVLTWVVVCGLYIASHFART
jgi:hypothetical protein